MDTATQRQQWTPQEPPPTANAAAGFSEDVFPVHDRQCATGGLSGLSILNADDFSDDFSLSGMEHSVSIPAKTDMLARSPEFSEGAAFGNFSGGDSFLEIVQNSGDGIPKFDNSTQFDFSADVDDASDKGLGPALSEYVSEPYEPSELADVDDLHAPQNDVTGVDLDACVSTALMSLPLQMPKPIWDEGVWSAIFGNGILINPDFCVPDLGKPVNAPFLDEWMEQITDCSRELKRSIHEVSSDSFADVVKHTTDRTWQEERESLLQSALKRWLMVVTSFKRSAVVWKQLAAETNDVKKLMVLADIFRGKAPATLMKRVRAVEKVCNFLGPDIFPCSEEAMYNFFKSERDLGAPPSRLKSYLEAMAFCLYTFSMDELRPVVASRRLHGCTIPAVPSAILQASPLTVDELSKIHEVLWAKSDWNSVFAGALLFVVYSRARWADAMHSDKLYPDRDAEGVTRYVEASAAVHKTMHASLYRHRLLPLVAPAVGVVDEPWVDRWMMVRAAVGVQLPPFNPMMPAPLGDGKASQRPLSATEAGAWLRKLLYGCKDQLKDRRISAHSLKATTLSYAAKFGLSAETRLQLAYHVGGFKMLHTYSRDAAAQPVLELERVLGAIRAKTFRPDSTRSGRFSSTGPGHCMDDAVLVDLTEPKQEQVSESEEVQSSSTDESSEEFPKAQARVFRPPEPPEGYVFWQHRKMKTLHITKPDFRRVFMCNRAIGPLHSKDNMSIRYDTPVCRNCAAAVKE